MDQSFNTAAYIAELKAEAPATRKCLERISETTFDFKPHPSSMAMGYLALLVAEIPLWITYIIEKGEVDFTTYPRFQPKNNKQLVDHFEKNLHDATQAMTRATEVSLSGDFQLKDNGKILFTSPKMAMIGSTLNHWVHHRGQLTVYMRMKEIPVPSVYGPSADDNHY